MIDARNIDRIRTAGARRATDPWRESAMFSDWAIRMTEQELAELGEAISALLAPLQRRTFAGEAPAGSRLVDVLTYLMPRPDERGEQPDA